MIAERIAMNEYLLSGGWDTEFKKTQQLEDVINEYMGAKQSVIMMQRRTIIIGIRVMYPVV